MNSISKSVPRIILGISAFYHDSGAAIVIDGKIIAACQEERFTRKKHDSAFPSNAIRSCLKISNLSLSDIDSIVFYEKPFLKFERLLETYLTFAPRGFLSFKRAIPVWIKEKLFQKSMLRKALNEIGEFSAPLKFSSHHYSHAASAFFPSPFKESLVLCLDGVGEWATTTLWHGKDNKIELLKEIHFPHSLGLLYSAFTYYIGFKVNSGEYKLMGLAPYGVDRYSEIIKKQLVEIKDDGSFRLHMKFFDYATGVTMTNSHFNSLFSQPARKPETELTQFHMDIAKSIQVVTEEILLKMTKAIRQDYKIPNLCLAGGVALNCVANGKIIDEKIFEKVWIQPAAGDAGGSLGAALGYWYQGLDRGRIPGEKDSMQGSYLGPQFSNDEIESVLLDKKMKFYKIDNQKKLIERIVNLLINEKVGGLFQGRMEFGPRSLGARSIIADPRSKNMQSILNLKIKFRESFRPFAPAVLAEKVKDWFELVDDSPYMMNVTQIKSKHHADLPTDYDELFGIQKLNINRSTIPAVTHLDFSARIQTVHKDTNSFFHELINQFDKNTGIPILVNTSFNVRGEPIVAAPIDALRCFMNTEMDFVVLENFLLLKEEQPSGIELGKVSSLELD
ncbi:MAG: hypothetical protein COW01_14715 [Bdellovibrionales bacterium CG12_big_fil_rev_8_21_14_0_65_38_15]|nr:MAG: hypothetical protein COW79_02850 [Bdellovibrionales bacterium CG22_combo_CG10-13_8_21_14_all_38_13]PIQ52936.1 MAG: hypothetical protein COW01_14715 [Bdellovibrionales bacterium CG12_big_fil_rev_8_21_14_0_65_38_15]PIR28346.1 MAG: hypothetical protein COV38_16110 [Bdellovibrionales bacterium CG11_big_fil_rev_8_21_14_0_20_38_13]